MGRINFLDLKRQYKNISEEIEIAIKEVCCKTAFSDGTFVRDFEKKFAEFLNVKYVSGLNSGTVALHFALSALKTGLNDEVIIPANTFIATAWGVSHTNATPVFVDCTSDTWNIDPNKIEEKITKKTKAIIGVHLYGQPFDVDAIKEITKKHNLFLIEDTAQSHGAKYKGNIVGCLTEMGCFSFYPGKNLGAYGEAGAVVSNNKGYIDMINCIRNQGSIEKYYHDMIGYNERMDGFQGAILSIKLKYLDKWNERRKEIAEIYQREITNPRIKMQKQPEWAESVYHLFVITTDNRNKLIKHFNENNIYPGIHYPVPCHLQKAYSFLNYKKGDFPNSEYLADHCLSLPMYPELANEEVEKVIEVINKY